MKGKTYRLADCPLDWCKKQCERGNISKDMRERLKLVIEYKEKHGDNA
ncbi:MAG: hypothetical protein NC131_00920 [Roseburia sp.]|nr:hypothetical protein [Roseburia sp.]